MSSRTVSRRTSGQGAGAGGALAEHTKSAAVLRHLQTFRKFDVSGVGTLSPAVVKEALQADGILFLDEEFEKLLAEAEIEGGTQLSFREYYDLAKKHNTNHLKTKNKLARIPRAYLSPEMWEQHAEMFRERADATGHLERLDLQQVLSKCNIHLPQDRLQTLLTQVDDGQGGSLSMTEFLLLVVKALNLKKREIGPGQCDLLMLKEEGWSILEIKRAGYEYHHFAKGGYELEDILTAFPAPELYQAGVSLSDMLSAGWDCARGKECGYSLSQMVQSGCSVQRIRESGFHQLDDAAALRALGVSAAKMKAGGWKLSDLKLAGYSLTELRQAGYTSLALGAMQQLAPSVPDKENIESQFPPTPSRFASNT